MQESAFTARSNKVDPESVLSVPFAPPCPLATMSQATICIVGSIMLSRICIELLSNVYTKVVKDLNGYAVHVAGVFPKWCWHEWAM